MKLVPPHTVPLVKLADDQWWDTTQACQVTEVRIHRMSQMSRVSHLLRGRSTTASPLTPTVRAYRAMPSTHGTSAMTPSPSLPTPPPTEYATRQKGVMPSDSLELRARSSRSSEGGELPAGGVRGLSLISATGNAVVRRQVKLLTQSVEEESDAEDDEASVLKERQHGGQTPEEERKVSE